MPHRLPLHVQAQRLPLVAAHAIVQPFHDLVVHTALMSELDRVSASFGGARGAQQPARALRCPPMID
jgi:hypothetical protein